MIKTLVAKLFPLACIIGLLWWFVTDPQSLTTTLSTLFQWIGGTLGEALQTFGEWLARQTGDGR